MFLGIDVSTYLEQQRIANSKYKKDGQEIDPFVLFKNNGVTYIRTRIWNDPYDEKGEPYLGGTCDLNNCIELLSVLKKYGFKNIIDFHYSDFWVDPSKQPLPKAWRNLNFDELVKAIYEFTKNSLISIKNAGFDVDFIQTGNEITHGMCWPHGKTNYDVKRPYEKFAALLKSARKACLEVYPNAKIIIHFEESYNQDLYRHVISGLLEEGLEIDIIGTSYYPFWHHSIKEYFANVDMIQNEFHLPVMNVEIGFPFTLKDYLPNETSHMSVNETHEKDYLPYLDHPISPDGQKEFLKDMIEQSKKHHLMGLCYWEPLWIPGEGICWGSEGAQKYQNLTPKNARNEWSNICLFDYEGNALPALEAYKL